MQFKRVQSGDAITPETFTAEAWNASQEAAIAHRERRSASSPPAIPGELNHRLRILVRNDSGVDLDRFEVLALGQPLIHPTANPNEWAARPAYTGEMATVASEGRFCVLQGPLKQGKIGEAIIAGVTPVSLTVTNLIDQFCDIQASSFSLATSAVGSAQVLWHQNVLGRQWAFVRLWGKSYGKAFVGLTNSAISAMSGSTPGVGVVTLYRLVSGVLVSRGVALTVYNMAGSVANNAWVQVKQDADGVWWIDVEKC